MPDKPAKNSTRKMWEGLLSSIPHGVKTKTISVTGDGDKKADARPDRPEPPTEPPTFPPFGPE